MNQTALVIGINIKREVIERAFMVEADLTCISKFHLVQNPKSGCLHHSQCHLAKRFDGIQQAATMAKGEISKNNDQLERLNGFLSTLASAVNTDLISASRSRLLFTDTRILKTKAQNSVELSRE